jgi:polysaccharide export outer membrane protein
VHRSNFSPALLAFALALPFCAAAQTARSGAPSQDIRVGAARASIDPRDTLTDGGLRTLSTPLAVPATMGRDYRLGSNDLLEVEVLDADNLRRTVRVNAAGAISLPLIGHVAVAGLTSQEAEERIAARYAERYLQNPQVSIFIKEFTTERITIEGAVAHPGIFPLTGQMTLLRALAVAGGFGSIANSKEVMLYRVNDQKQRESHVYDIEKIRAGQADDPPIKGDDLIVVQRDSMRAALKDSLFRDVIDSINPFSLLVPH